MFDFELKIKNTNALVIFSGQLEGDDIYYGDQIDVILKRRNSPYKYVIFLFPKYIENKIREFLGSDSKLESNLNRASGADYISLVTFDGYSDLRLHSMLADRVDSPIAFDKNFRNNLIKSGLLFLVESKKEKIILTAPPGTVFEKPSKKRFAEFIKASELAVGFSENQFVAFALLSHRPRRDDAQKIKHIWIDTSSISQYVESLVYYISRFNGDEYRTLQYHSFQSYGDHETAGYKACIPDVKDNVWVIISASRSNDMGVDIYQTWVGLQHDQITTLLSYTDSKMDQDHLSHTHKANPEFPSRPGDNVVVNISKFSACHNIEKKYGSEIPVKIIGENFTAQVEKPNAVLLRRPHGPVEISQFVELINQNEYLFANKIKSNKLRSIFFDFVKFNKGNSKLKNEYMSWLKDIVGWYVPSSLGAIIYDFTDEASKLLYNDIRSLINSGNILEVDLNGGIEIDSARAIIAIVPVMTRGTSFIKLNSDLRLVGHSAQRIFIAPFSLSHTKSDFDAFSKSLGMAPKGLRYQFFNFRKIFIGHQESQNSWERELAVTDKFQNAIWRKRTEILQAQSQGIANAIGNCCEITQEKLKFNIDFAFWQTEYEPEKVNPVAVYLTLSSILQNLREKPFTMLDKESLYTHVYQHSVLDPNNFSRFNDPLLQSCLWRCAYDGELDYRTPDYLSKQFCDIIKRLATSRANGERNATLDLLMAVAVRKIQLSTECVSEMIESLKRILAKFPEFDEILDFIGNDFRNQKLDGQEF